MATDASNKIKVAFIGLVILNLAFISGFVVKKISASNSSNTSKAANVSNEPNISDVPNVFEASRIFNTTSPKTSFKPVDSGQSCILNDKQVGYRYLCKKPGFQETFEEYRELHRNASLKLSQIKSAYLRELKKEHSDTAAIEKIVMEMNRTANELNQKNYRHLLSLKSLLSPQDFTALIDCMNHTLNAHSSSLLPRKNTSCGDTDSHKNTCN